MFRLLSSGIHKKGVRQKSRMLLDKYTIIKELGNGATSTVYKVMDNDTSVYFTCKTIVENKYNTAMREINILNKLPNDECFAKFKESIKGEKDSINIITKYIAGKDLFDWFYDISCVDKSVIDENCAKQIFKNMVIVTEKLHKQKIVHLDIKLENFIISDEVKKSICMIDYASCHPHSDKKMQLSKMVGTRGYAPYEIYKGYYTSKSDVWSLGVCLWLLLTKTTAFDHNKLSYSNCKDITSKDFTFPLHTHNGFRHQMSDEVFDLLKKMLVINPNKRISLSDILKHPWFEYLVI